MRQFKKGFTLVELLVVIAIIAMLVTLLLPAVQAAREAARRTQCINNLKQLALGALNCESTHGHLPSGGWGWDWAGDADRGAGIEQPSGWVYNTLPFIEFNDFYNLAADGRPEEITEQQKDGTCAIIRKPISFINCPTRRESRPYPNAWRAFYAYNACQAKTNDDAGRLDYAINAGSITNNEFNGGPSSISAAPNYAWPAKGLYNGVCYMRSSIKIGQLEDGTSKTYLIGEKYLNPTNYTTGMDPADNETWCTGYNNDNFRIAFNLPKKDRQGIQDTTIFGSAHNSGWNMSFCDGHVETLGYDIDLFTHKAYANRRGNL